MKIADKLMIAVAATTLATSQPTEIRAADDFASLSLTGLREVKLNSEIQRASLDLGERVSGTVYDLRDPLASIKDAMNKRIFKVGMTMVLAVVPVPEQEGKFYALIGGDQTMIKVWDNNRKCFVADSTQKLDRNMPIADTGSFEILTSSGDLIGRKYGGELCVQSKRGASFSDPFTAISPDGQQVVSENRVANIEVKTGISNLPDGVKIIPLTLCDRYLFQTSTVISINGKLIPLSGEVKQLSVSTNDQGELMIKSVSNPRIENRYTLKEWVTVQRLVVSKSGDLLSQSHDQTTSDLLDRNW